MNLYHISQTGNAGYDTYSDAVVAAKSKQAASRIHSSDYVDDWTEQTAKQWSDRWSWTTHPSKVTVKLIGVTNNTITQGVVCASFHPG